MPVTDGHEHDSRISYRNPAAKEIKRSSNKISAIMTSLTEWLSAPGVVPRRARTSQLRATFNRRVVTIAA